MENTTLQTTPGLVLIHGAGLGNWVWEKLLPLLSLPTLAVDLPGRQGSTLPLNSLTLEAYVQSVLDDIDAFKHEQVIVVAHSLGGEIALRLATRIPEHIAGLMFLGALVPRSRKSYLSLVPPLQALFLRLLLRFSTNGMRPPDALIRSTLCNDLDEPSTSIVLKRYAPESRHCFLDPVQWGPLPAHLLRSYVKLLKDKSGFPPPLQDRMAATLQATNIVTLDTGHLPMLSKPDELATMINAFVHEIREIS